MYIIRIVLSGFRTQPDSIRQANCRRRKRREERGGGCFVQPTLSRKKEGKMLLQKCGEKLWRERKGGLPSFIHVRTHPSLVLHRGEGERKRKKRSLFLTFCSRLRGRGCRSRRKLQFSLSLDPPHLCTTGMRLSNLRNGGALPKKGRGEEGALPPNYMQINLNLLSRKSREKYSRLFFPFWNIRFPAEIWDYNGGKVEE